MAQGATHGLIETVFEKVGRAVVAAVGKGAFVIGRARYAAAEQ